jgi:hypothetical protein
VLRPGVMRDSSAFIGGQSPLACRSCIRSTRVGPTLEQDALWSDVSKSSGITGSPGDPQAAIPMSLIGGRARVYWGP